MQLLFTSKSIIVSSLILQMPNIYIFAFEKKYCKLKNVHIFKFLENAIFEATVVRKKIVRLKKILIWKSAFLNHNIK